MSTSLSRAGNLQPVDPIWSAVRDEAEAAVVRDPLLAAFLYVTILNHDNLKTSSSTASPSGSATPISAPT